MPRADTDLTQPRSTTNPSPADRALSPRKARLLRAAAELFAASGYHAVSTDAIGQAAGISGPGVYRHFGSKADLLLTLCETVMDALLSAARHIAADASSDDAILEGLVNAHIEFAIQERLALAVYFREQQQLPALEYRALRRRQREYESIWCQAIAARSDLPDVEVRAAVKLVLSMCNGTIYIKDTLARTRQTELMQHLAAGALRGLGLTAFQNGELPSDPQRGR